MEWISVNDRLPEQGQNVLVFGFGNSDLSDEKYPKSIGLVSWDNIDYSSCVDTCYYDVWYSDITHWMPLPAPPNS